MKTRCILLLLIAVFGLSGCFGVDIEEVTLSGQVTEGATGKPVVGLNLYFRNYYYEGGDGVGYMPVESYTSTTDPSGEYRLELSRSAYIQIDTLPFIESLSGQMEVTDFFTEYYVKRSNTILNFQIDRSNPE